MAGAPLGNKNAAGPRDRAFSDAVRRAALAENGKRLRALAEALLDKAGEGDVAALREAADRIEGKVPQAIEGPGKDGAHKFELVAPWLKEVAMKRGWG